MTTKIALAGAAGRMGRRIIALAASDAEIKITAAADVTDATTTATDAGELAGIGKINLPIRDDITADFDVLIDFSSPAGTMHWLDLCEKHARPILIGATGHTVEQQRRIHAASEKIAVLRSANMSVGVNVLLSLVRQLAATLDISYDVEISETHHREKKDAPSGTALALKDAVIEGRNASPMHAHILYGRSPQSPKRQPGEIGMHSLRLGDTVGDHSVSFGGWGETITLSHSAHSRDTFAAGALRAAKWLTGKPAGAYSMAEVLGIAK